MPKKPAFYALGAALYIIGIVLLIQSFTVLVPKDTLLIPITMLSLFVLSAAVMGYLFLYEPLCLYFDNKKQEAVTFFGKTVGIFACFVVVVVAALLLVSTQ